MAKEFSSVVVSRSNNNLLNKCDERMVGNFVGNCEERTLRDSCGESKRRLEEAFHVMESGEAVYSMVEGDDRDGRVTFDQKE